MAYIGNTVENQGFTPAIDYFNGDGVTVTFTLSRPIASVAQVIVAIDNVIQNPNSSFTVAGNAITFSSAPLSGTNNIWVEYTSLITTYQAISQDPTVIGDIRATGGYLAEGDFGNSFVAGAIVDYVTGLGRVTVGPAEGIALYNGGTASRTERMRIDSIGNVGIGTSTIQPWTRLQVTGTAGAQTGANQQIQVSAPTTTAGQGAGIRLSAASGAKEAVAVIGVVNEASGNSGALVFHNYNGGANIPEYMRIDSSGRVTTPNQPFFYARKTVNQTITTGTVVTFDTITTNTGSNYSTSTNRFTAPIAGVYSFSAKVWISRNGASYADFSPFVNGTAIPSGAGAYYDSAINSTGYANYLVNLQYYLNAGDYIDFRIGTNGGGQTVVIDNSGYFCGFLVG